MRPVAPREPAVGTAIREFELQRPRESAGSRLSSKQAELQKKTALQLATEHAQLPMPVPAAMGPSISSRRGKLSKTAGKPSATHPCKAAQASQDASIAARCAATWIARLRQLPVWIYGLLL